VTDLIVIQSRFRDPAVPGPAVRGPDVPGQFGSKRLRVQVRAHNAGVRRVPAPSDP